MTESDATSTPTALIIGASSGVGRALAERCQQDGQRVFGMGRRDYASIADPPFSREHYLAGDLSDAGNSVTAVQTFLDECGVEQLDLVIYAAGFGYYGEFGAQSPASMASMTAVQALTPIALTRALAPNFAPRQ